MNKENEGIERTYFCKVFGLFTTEIRVTEKLWGTFLLLVGQREEKSWLQIIGDILQVKRHTGKTTFL